MQATRMPTVVWLLGGRSRRFGADKRCALLDGEPLWQRGLRRLDGAFSRALLVAPAARQLAWEGPPLKSLRVETWPHEVPDRGPVAALRGLGEVLPGGFLLVASDMPWIHPEALKTLWRLSQGRTAVTPVDSQGRCPLVLALRPLGLGPLAKLLAASPNPSFRELLEALGAHKVAQGNLSSDSTCFRDVDRPEDLPKGPAFES